MSNWEQAWVSAQPRLTRLRDSLNPYNSPHRPVKRVGQLDAELLDLELLHLLQDPLTNALTSINVRERFHIPFALFKHRLVCAQISV
jgi:peroxin-2